jgi:predicted Zn-ribbon and HTH transcriptional regulator
VLKLYESICQEYTDKEKQAAIDKLFVVVKVLENICGASRSVKKLKNHSVHGFNDFLFSLASGSFISRGELKLLILEAQELNNDFIRSRNSWVKERTQLVVDLMQEIIDGNFDVKPIVFALIDEKYPKVEKVKEQIPTKKFHHQVLKDTTCPSCSFVFSPIEIKDFLDIGYRCPKCRQAIRIV